MRFSLLPSLPLLVGCTGGGTPIVYIVPAGHVGPVWAVVDPQASEPPNVSGRRQVVFPAGGVLKVPSLAVFGRNEFTSRFDAATPFPYLTSGSKVAPTTVGFWEGWHGSSKPGERDYFVWFVGTESQFLSFKSAGDQAPPTKK